MADTPTAPRLSIVTGGQGGIGLAIAEALSRAGDDVVIADLAVKVSGEVLAERWGSCSVVQCLACDIGKESDVDALFSSMKSTFGRSASLLVNNAAMQVWSPLLELSLADWERTLRVNLTGTFLMTQYFAREHQSGSADDAVIINIGSGCNHLAFPNLVSYVASKGGVEMLTKASALELGPLGIRVNCIAPGAIETERTRAETATFAQSWQALTPMGRVGEVSDIAEAVVALASPAMAFVSGQTLKVDGGLFSRAPWPEVY